MNADQTLAISLGVIFFSCALSSFCIAWRRTNEDSEERIQAFLDRV